MEKKDRTLNILRRETRIFSIDGEDRILAYFVFFFGGGVRRLDQYRMEEFLYKNREEFGEVRGMTVLLPQEAELFNSLLQLFRNPYFLDHSLGSQA